MKKGILKQRGFTLIELLVVIAIISILASILFPVFARARENARRASCMSNEKQMGLGLMMYAQDYDEKLPQYNYGVLSAGGYWNQQIYPYVKNQQIFRCPSARATTADFTSLYYSTYAIDGTAQGSGYIYAGVGTPLASITEPAITWMLVESQYSTFRWENNGWGRAAISFATPTVPEDSDAFRKDAHLDGSNVTFADGHVKWVKNGSHGVGYRWKKLSQVVVAP
jgi:prepilin-type N-terminal cleavage/methylation domain-containing protein/prepilin-type processing-associated H-X9-DG protein